MVTRRALLLAASALPALALVGCGDDDDDGAAAGGPGSPVGASDFPPSSDPARNIPEDQRGKVNVVVAGVDWFVGTNNFVFGITNKDDEPQGGAKTRATFYDLSDPKSPKPAFQAEATPSAPGVHAPTEHIHPNGEVHIHGGEDEGRVGYYVKVNFPHAGTWGVAVEAILKDGTRGISSVGFDVQEQPAVPAPGQPAPKSENLTKDDVDDIRKIDSGDPPNDMHTVKISQAIAAGRPLVVVFSTPAYCTSRFCGPVNEEVEDLQTKYRDRVDFVHIEIWLDRETNTFNPTASEWLLRPDGSMIEPYVYAIGKDGVIYDRWEGPVAANIMDPSVSAIAAGKVYGS
jgi:hypothetical protein